MYFEGSISWHGSIGFVLVIAAKRRYCIHPIKAALMPGIHGSIMVLVCAQFIVGKKAGPRIQDLGPFSAEVRKFWAEVRKF